MVQGSSEAASAAPSSRSQDEERRLQEYAFLKQLGRGMFGHVFLVKHKVVSYGGLRSREKQQLVSEVNVMRALVHRNVVRYLDRVVCRRRQLLFILMEYCDLGDLAGLIQTAHRHLGGIDPKRAADVAAQLLSALAYCHSGPHGVKVLHRDLKPSNVFVASDPTAAKDASLASSNNANIVVKLGDFGLSRHLNVHSLAHSCVGTPYYWSPELLADGPKNYDDRCDMWALGCLLFELCTGKSPFSEAQTLTDLKRAVAKGPRLPLAGVPPSLNKLIASLLQPVAEKRPSALECLGFALPSELSALGGAASPSATASRQQHPQGREVSAVVDFCGEPERRQRLHQPLSAVVQEKEGLPRRCQQRPLSVASREPSLLPRRRGSPSSTAMKAADAAAASPQASASEERRWRTLGGAFSREAFSANPASAASATLSTQHQHPAPSPVQPLLQRLPVFSEATAKQKFAELEEPSSSARPATAVACRSSGSRSPFASAPSPRGTTARRLSSLEASHAAGQEGPSCLSGNVRSSSRAFPERESGAGLAALAERLRTDRRPSISSPSSAAFNQRRFPMGSRTCGSELRRASSFQKFGALEESPDSERSSSCFSATGGAALSRAGGVIADRAASVSCQGISRLAFPSSSLTNCASSPVSTTASTPASASGSRSSTSAEGGSSFASLASLPSRLSSVAGKEDVSSRSGGIETLAGEDPREGQPQAQPSVRFGAEEDPSYASRGGSEDLRACRSEGAFVFRSAAENLYAMKENRRSRFRDVFENTKQSDGLTSAADDQDPRCLVFPSDQMEKARRREASQPSSLISAQRKGVFDSAFSPSARRAALAPSRTDAADAAAAAVSSLRSPRVSWLPLSSPRLAPPSESPSNFARTPSGRRVSDTTAEKTRWKTPPSSGAQENVRAFENFENFGSAPSLLGRRGFIAAEGSGESAAARRREFFREEKEEVPLFRKSSPREKALAPRSPGGPSPGAEVEFLPLLTRRSSAGSFGFRA